MGVGVGACSPGEKSKKFSHTVETPEIGPVPFAIFKVMIH